MWKNDNRKVSVRYVMPYPNIVLCLSNCTPTMWNNWTARRRRTIFVNSFTRNTSRKLNLFPTIFPFAWRDILLYGLIIKSLITWIDISSHPQIFTVLLNIIISNSSNFKKLIKHFVINLFIFVRTSPHLKFKNTVQSYEHFVKGLN